MEGEGQDNVDKLVRELKRVVQVGGNAKNNAVTDIIQALVSLADINKTTEGEISEFIADDVFLVLLAHESKEVVAETARAIAAIAKTEKGRDKCTDDNLVETLVNLLKDDDIRVLTQACRALGNICYENEKGKRLVRERDALANILQVLKRAASLGDTGGAGFLRNVSAGFLFNFLSGEDDLLKKALEFDVLSVICSILEIDGVVAKEAATHAMLVLGILTDLGHDILDERLTKVLVDILADNASPELAEMCLQLLYEQAENESTKLLLAKGGVCELLLESLDEHGPFCVNEEARSALKMACNLIVLILTGDESMNLLYNGSNGKVYKRLSEWLESEDEDLQVTAVLAMGNFACTGTHCMLMVSQGVHKKLLHLLKENTNSSCNIRLQHALLTALRNLVIPSKNKPVVLADGLIDVVYPMLDIPTFPVVFKLLGTLRIVIDGQQEAATSLGRREDLIERAVEWCGTEDHPGVQGEAYRLIAWLIKNSRDEKVFSSVIKHGAVKYLVKMLVVQHALMQNEAAISLTILVTTSLFESEASLLEAEIGRTMCKFLDESAPKLEPPMILNAVSLTESLIKSETMKEHLLDAGLPVAWRKLMKLRIAEITDLKEKLQPLYTAMGMAIDDDREETPGEN